MKKVTLVLGLIAIAIFVGLASAKAASTDKAVTASELKLGYVDIQKALDSVEDAKKAKETLKKEFDQKKNKIDFMKKEIETMQAELEKQKLVLSSEALQAKQNELQQKVNDFRQNAMQYQQELSQKEQTAVSSILQTFEAIITEIGQKEGYSLILEKSRDRLLYAPANFDLTDKVIAAYNKKGKK